MRRFSKKLKVGGLTSAMTRIIIWSVMEWAKRECILKSATKIFQGLGFRKASVDEIARDAGVAKGTVYLACDSKADLFYQSVHREVRTWIGEISKIIEPRIPADELLLRSARASIQYLETHPLVRDLLLGVYSGQIPGWADRFDELRDLGRANLAEILKMGMRQGVFRDDMDPELTSSVLQDLNLAGYLYFSRVRGEADRPMQERFDVALDVVLNGLRSRTQQEAKA
jgi:AcrR family transcriptional regulator